MDILVWLFCFFAVVAGGLLLFRALPAWKDRRARNREAEEDAALAEVLRDPEHVDKFSDETLSKADRAALRERLKGGRR